MSASSKLLIALLLLCAASTWASPAPQGLDLARVESRASFLEHLQVLEENASAPLQPIQALRAEGWQPATPQNLAAPRRFSTLWLRGTLHNGSDLPLTRWLEVMPWRLSEVQLMLLRPDAMAVESLQLGGLAQPIAQREVPLARTIFPLTLAPGETRQVLLRLHSDSRPYVALDVWEPVAFIQNNSDGRVLHAALLACVLTLLLVLLLQLDGRKALLGVWVVLAYGFEAEKEGYITFHYLSAWAEHGLFLRASFGVLSNAAFLLASLLLLDLWRLRSWRAIHLALVGTALLLMPILPLLEANTARGAAAGVISAILLFWPLSLLAVRLKGEPCRQILLLLFALNWAESLVFVVSYLMNLGYTALFGTGAIIIKIGTILGIIAVFALQKRRDERKWQRESLASERQRNAWLEETVAQRTLELHKALLAANEANRGKSEFLARVSHDLRSPLTSIIGYAQLLHLDPTKMGHNVGVILRSATRMLSLINDLIEYACGASSDRLEIAPLYIHGLLDEVALEANVLAASNGNSFVLNIRDELPPVLLADGKRVRQVLLNLLGNAAKFTRNGRVELQVDCRRLDTHPEQVRLEFCVRDNGCGIAPQNQAEVFKPFFRIGDVAIEGAGLGLSIVDEWTRRMGGELQLCSTPGEGTRVTIGLALTVGSERDLAAPQLLDTAYASPALAGNGRPLWVVEDSPEIRELLVGELSRAGFVVHDADDGQTFIDHLRDSRCERPALVLTDYLMPGADGAAVLAAVRERWSGVPVVLLSATQKTMQSLELQADQGFDASLLKPISLGELHGTLARLLDVQAESAHVQVSVAAPVDEMDAPSAQVLAELEQLVAMGAMSDLIEWAENLQRQQPRYQSFALWVTGLAEMGDFDTLRQYLDATEPLDDHSIASSLH